MLTHAGKAAANFPFNADVLVVIPGGQPKCSIEFKDTSGTTRCFAPLCAASSHNLAFSSMATNNNSAIYVGSGSTAPTEDDYVLESQITSGLSGSVNSVYGYDSENNVVTVSDVITLTNTSNSDITINEIAKTATFYIGESIGGDISGTGASYKKNVMVDRTVLESSVVIPPSGSAVIHYTFAYEGYVAS